MADCLFCKIAKGEIPADIVYEDDAVVAFRDINPQAPTHVLVIPREHVEYLTDLTGKHGKLLAQIFNGINKVAEKEGISESGFRAIGNCKRDGQQTVFHIHFHLLGGRQMTWPPG
ncbi:MAG: histidine triad nucleotide-binding protein [bacterium]